MEKERFDSLVAENMKTILGFALTRLSDMQRAEELASDIIYELLRSASKLKNEDSFYAFMWTVAERTYADHLRARYKASAVCELDESVADTSDSALDDIVRREELGRLRRELSLLSEQHRCATVLYYMENTSCSEIAQKINISAEMVKYYLFRARKIIREGMDMDRFFGEKSYKPSAFEIDFWGRHGGSAKEYNDFDIRRIKGNILLAAYYAPTTAQEISIELGVSMPYLEDELAILTERQYLIQKNGKYITNIPIFTSDCRDAVRGRIDEKVAGAVGNFIKSVGDGFCAKYGDRFGNENFMRWQIATLAVRFALLETDNDYGELPTDGPYSHIMGGEGIIWGRTSEESSPEPEHGINGIYNGIDSGDGRGSVVAINFAEIGNGQRFVGGYEAPLVTAALGYTEHLPVEWQNRLENECYIADGKPNFAVWTSSEHDDIKGILHDCVSVLTGLVRETSVTAADITADMAPDHIRSAARYAGAVVYRFDAIERVIAELCRTGWLLPVANTDKPAMCVIIE